MITKIQTLRELPYKSYTGHLLKSEDDVKNYTSGWLYISVHPRMIILFEEYIEEFDSKIVKNK